MKIYKFCLFIIMFLIIIPIKVYALKTQISSQIIIFTPETFSGNLIMVHNEEKFISPLNKGSSPFHINTADLAKEHGIGNYGFLISPNSDDKEYFPGTNIAFIVNIVDIDGLMIFPFAPVASNNLDVIFSAEINMRLNSGIIVITSK